VIACYLPAFEPPRASPAAALPEGKHCEFYRCFSYQNHDRSDNDSLMSSPAPRKKPRRRSSSKPHPGAGLPSAKNTAADGKPSELAHPIALERRRPRDYAAEAESHIRDLQRLTQSLIEAREQEQQDLSRELHDNIAQVLSAATARISLAQNESIPAWLRQELLDLRDHLKAALADVRHLARDLRPALLDHLGFAAALEKHAEAFRERTNINLGVRLDPEAVSFLESEYLTHLFRLAQEALQNIEDHAAADQAWIRLAPHSGALLLEIGDNGCGFAPERVVEAQADGHLGLLGMRERAELLGGQFVLETEPAQGTIIRVSIPPPPAKPGPDHRL
jgi:signal transduction histidine kinase